MELSKTGSDQSAPLLDLTDRDGLHQSMANAVIARLPLPGPHGRPQTSDLVGEHEGEGGMTVGDGEKMWATCSGESPGSAIARVL